MVHSQIFWDLNQIVMNGKLWHCLLTNLKERISILQK